MSIVNKMLRLVYNKYNQRRLTNRDITLFSSNCNGGVILHDLGLRFNSPFVNLWIKPKDFIKICEKPEYYLKCDLSFTTEEGVNYPIGVLNDVKIYFQHYETETEAKNKWDKRKKRINYDNLFILFTDRDGCTFDDLKKFDSLKFENKVVFVHNKCPEIKSAVYIPGFEKETSVGMCMNFKNRFTARRYFDAFDYVTWFNDASSKIKLRQNS